MNRQPNSPPTRRSWMQAALAGAAGLLATRPTSAAPLEKGAVVLFQGDSITDARRDREQKEANDPLGFGYGYPLLIASRLLEERAGDGLQFYNRGISGNKVPDLDARWQDDALDLQPDLISILIGVNDIWHKLNGRYDGTVERYETGYAALLERTRMALPDVRLVVCEPFVLRTGAVDDSWFPEFDERRAAARRVAEQAGATWVPLQETFDAAVERAEPAYWAADGVHPTMAGHALMAQAWIEAVQP